MKKEVKFIFDNEESAEHFLSWLCGSGEQSYWKEMEYREEEEDGNITVLAFDYWNGTKDGTKDGKQFGTGDIVCKSGRMDNDWACVAPTEEVGKDG